MLRSLLVVVFFLLRTFSSTKHSVAFLQKYNLHYENCQTKNISSTADKILRSYVTDGTTLLIHRGVTSAPSTISSCPLPNGMNFSTRFPTPIRHKNGRCQSKDHGKPYETFICHCHYGYGGIICEEEMKTTHFSLTWIWWIVTLIEAVVVLLGIYRFLYKKTASPYAAARFLEVLLEDAETAGRKRRISRNSRRHTVA